MAISHSKNQFNQLKRKKNNFIFFEQIKNLNFDPIQGFINLVDDQKYSFLYESVEKEKGRYSICGYDPITKITLKKNRLFFEITNKKKEIKYSNNPLPKVDQIIKKIKFDKINKLPQMAGSYFGFISYENIHNIENINQNKKKNKLNTPDIVLFIPRYLIIFDNLTKTLYILKHFISTDRSKKNEYENTINEFNDIRNKLRATSKKNNYNLKKKKRIAIKSNIKKEKFLQNIKRAKKYIKNGDIFQVVPSQRFEINFKNKSSSLYEVLRITNPSPYMYYFKLPNFQIVGSSPEILVRLKSNDITIRPIAGTRPRGKDKRQDKLNEIDLLSDKKELAEHLMLLDLGRNDIGKVARKSSIRVTSQFVIEKYSHVMHIVSNVTGKLKKNTTPISALMAGFPAGTVSGAPKIRAMQIINELENEARGIYAGGIGYISPHGDMDTCIVLRTGIISKNKLYVQAGGGVVYDSDPELEYFETVNKAKAVLNAAAVVLGNQ